MKTLSKNRRPLPPKKYIDGIISKKNAPSGGSFNECCLNSELFKKRECKKDGKIYEDGELCPCFTED